jgi:hypothetical protein
LSSLRLDREPALDLSKGLSKGISCKAEYTTVCTSQTIKEARASEERSRDEDADYMVQSVEFGGMPVFVGDESRNGKYVHE